MKIDSKLLFCNCLGIFQGGGVKAIAYAGAYDEARKAGIGFSHVAGTSAGAIFAALIAAGASPEKILEIAHSQDLKKIPVPHIKETCNQYVILFSAILIIVSIAYLIANGHTWFWTIFIIAIILTVYSEWLVLGRNAIKSVRTFFGYNDSAIIAETVDHWLHDIMGKRDDEEITFNKLPLDLTIYSCDVSQKKVFRWSKHDSTIANIRVADAVAASCSIPLYFSPTKLNDNYHVDGGLLINRPNRIHSSLPNYYQALSFRLKTTEKPIKNFKDYILSLAATVIDGPDTLRNQDENTDSQIYGHGGVNDVDLLINGVSATSFDKLTPETVESLINAGREGFKRFMEKTDSQIRIYGSKSFSVSSNRTLNEIDYVHNQVAFWSYEKCDSILISDVNLDWVWPLFPTLVAWINNQINVVVKYSSEANQGRNSARLEAQNRLLQSLGIQTADIPSNVLIKGFFFRHNDECKCILLDKQDSQVKPQLLAKVYNSGIDSIFVSKIWDIVCNTLPVSQKGTVSLIREEPTKIIGIIGTVGAYSVGSRSCVINFEQVNVRDLRFVKREIRSLKFKELRIIDALFDNAGVQRYSPASLKFIDGKTSLMTPIIVEDHDGTLVVIKGNTRCYKAYSDNGINTTVPVFIVHNPPSINKSEFFEITELLLSEMKNRGVGQLEPNRAVDQAFRPDATYLI